MVGEDGERVAGRFRPGAQDCLRFVENAGDGFVRGRKEGRVVDAVEYGG